MSNWTEIDAEELRKIEAMKDPDVQDIVQCSYLRGRYLDYLEAENAELRKIAEDAVALGKSQAEEWDRFWQALGVCSEDISVDDAVKVAQSMTTLIQDLSAGWDEHDDENAPELGCLLREVNEKLKRWKAVQSE